jgi:hypothetical protein
MKSKIDKYKETLILIQNIFPDMLTKKEKKILQQKKVNYHVDKIRDSKGRND